MVGVGFAPMEAFAEIP